MTCVCTASLAQQPHASQLLQEIPENIAYKYFGCKERGNGECGVPKLSGLFVFQGSLPIRKFKGFSGCSLKHFPKIPGKMFEKIFHAPSWELRLESEISGGYQFLWTCKVKAILAIA